jgi:DNA polymerase delta subunit 1
MVQFDTQGRTGKEALEYSWQLGERASRDITKLFKSPNDLELEKVYCPYFLYSKKRYAAKMWVMGKGGIEMDKIDIKGLQVIRRDNCQFVRDVCENIINMILDSSDPSEPLAFVEQKRRELLGGHVHMDKLMMSKRLGDSYKSANLAHVAVRDKIRERTPGSEPQSGDRVQFVIVDTGDKKHKMYQKAEDPAFVVSNNLQLDYEYYLKHQFETPIKDLLEPLLSTE